MLYNVVRGQRLRYIGYSVRFDWFCSNCWAFFSSVTDESRINRAGCLVVVLVLASAFLHVKISVKVVRVFLGNFTSFWSTFVLGGGGGNVTFHGIQFPREILYH